MFCSHAFEPLFFVCSQHTHIIYRYEVLQWKYISVTYRDEYTKIIHRPDQLNFSYVFVDDINRFGLCAAIDSHFGYYRLKANMFFLQCKTVVAMCQQWFLSLTSIRHIRYIDLIARCIKDTHTHRVRLALLVSSSHLYIIAFLFRSIESTWMLYNKAIL